MKTTIKRMLMDSRPVTSGVTAGYSRVFHISCMSRQAGRTERRNTSFEPPSFTRWLTTFIATILQKKVIVQVLYFKLKSRF